MGSKVVTEGNYCVSLTDPSFFLGKMMVMMINTTIFTAP